MDNQDIQRKTLTAAPFQKGRTLMAYTCIDCGSFTSEHWGTCGEPLCSACASRSFIYIMPCVLVVSYEKKELARG
jgi:uncharacterized Zn finger protein (UPF0148 family)